MQKKIVKAQHLDYDNATLFEFKDGSELIVKGNFDDRTGEEFILDENENTFRFEEKFSTETSKIVLGTSKNKKVKLDVRKQLVETGLAVLGQRRSGKSYAANKIAEEILEKGIPIIAIDTEAEYHALAKKYDNLLVASVESMPDADVEGLYPSKTKKLVDKCIKNNLGIILNLQTTSLRRRYEVLTAFLGEIHSLTQSGQWKDKTYVMVQEEAHRLIPENTMTDLPDDNRGGRGQEEASIQELQEQAAYYSTELVSTGGHVGLGYICITQRSAKVSKNVLAECGTKLVFRLDKSTEENYLRKAGLDEQKKEIESLDVGECFLVRGGEPRKMKIDTRETEDLGETPFTTTEKKKSVKEVVDEVS